MNFSSPLVFVLLLLWINWNVLEYNIPVNWTCLFPWTSLSIIGTDCFCAFAVIDTYNTICIFFLWVHYTFVYEIMFFKLVIRSIYSSVNGGNIPHNFFTDNKSRSDCLTGTSKYVIQFYLWWIHVIIGWSLSNVLFYLSMVLTSFPRISS